MAEESIVDRVFDDEFDAFVEVEDTINDIVNLLQLYPELYTTLQDDFLKSNIKQFNIKEHAYLSNMTKRKRAIKEDTINYEQLKYMNDQIAKKVDKILLKNTKDGYFIMKKEKTKNKILMDDERFQLELEKIMIQEDRDVEVLDSSISAKILNFSNEDVEVFENIDRKSVV